MTKNTPSQTEAITSNAAKILCIAGPGSGKTYTVIQRILRLINDGAEPMRMVCITFTNAAAKEIHTRLNEHAPGTSLGYLGTLHGYCLRQLQTLGSSLGYSQRITVLDQQQSDDMLMDIAKDMGCKASLKRLQDQRKTLAGRPRTPEHIAIASYLRTLRASSTVDFDTILADFSELIRADKIPWFDHLIVDELQDSAFADFWIYTNIKVSNLFLVGDPDQCQPAGTMVRMSDGTENPIDRITPGDSVVSYARHEKVIIRNARVAAVSRRSFRGLLYTVSAGGNKTECTGNHRWLIKWRSGAERTRSGWCVYLMRKGDNFRVGKTCLFRSSGKPGEDVIGLALRMRQESADQGWILSTHSTEGEALSREDVVSATYGLPQTCFRSNSANRGYTQAVIDAIFAALPKQLVKALNCLQDHGRELAYPLFCKTQPRTRRTVQEIHACNMLDDVMHVPTFPNAYSRQERGGNWVPVKVTTRQFSGDVFSMDVEKHHKYVADGIVTCNSIYAFRGGDVDGILSLAKRDDWKVISMEGNFRCALDICQAANTLIRKNKKRVDKITQPMRDIRADVTVLQFASDIDEQTEILQDIRGMVGDVNPNEIAVLARNNAIVRELAANAESMGIPVRKKKMAAVPMDWPLARAAVELINSPTSPVAQRQFLRLKHGKEMAAKIERAAQIRQTFDLCEHIENLTRNCRVDGIGQALARLAISRESIALIEAKRDLLTEPDLTMISFAIARDLESDSELGEGVTFTTIHSAKGREWETVFLVGFEQELIPGTAASRDVEEERRVAFVGMTRAKDVLVISHCRSRRATFGQKRPLKATRSQFVTEAGL